MLPACPAYGRRAASDSRIITLAMHDQRLDDTNSRAKGLR